MNQNAELLNFIYQNSEMGEETMEQILHLVKDAGMRKCLSDQQKEYKAIHDRAGRLLNANGYDEKSIGMFDKVTAYIMINMKTLIDKSDSHIAQMLIQGSNMGITDAAKRINQYEGSAEKDILALMKKLQKTEEDNVECLKEYL